MPRRKLFSLSVNFIDSHQDEQAKIVSKQKRISLASESVGSASFQPICEPSEEFQGPTPYVLRRLRHVDVWANLRTKLLHANVELEAHSDVCVGATECTSVALTRCKDCGPNVYLCSQCCIERHQSTLYHCPEIYDEVRIQLKCLKFNFQPCF